jgi:hypothetical protein
VITEPETPPPDAPSASQTNSHLIHRIIASNEALIHQQMMAIRDLQTNNADLEHRLKLASEKYDTLYELAFARRDRTPTQQPSSIDN